MAYRPEILKRVKGQRYDKRLLPTLLFQISPTKVQDQSDLSDDGPTFDFVVVGQSEGYDPSGLPCTFDQIEVTTDTHIVPAYRKYDESDKNWNICQAYTYKAIPR
jgi:hypothetical protein